MAATVPPPLLLSRGLATATRRSLRRGVSDAPLLRLSDAFSTSSIAGGCCDEYRAPTREASASSSGQLARRSKAVDGRLTEMVGSLDVLMHQLRTTGLKSGDDKLPPAPLRSQSLCAGPKPEQLTRQLSRGRARSVCRESSLSQGVRSLPSLSKFGVSSASGSGATGATPSLRAKRSSTSTCRPTVGTCVWIAKPRSDGDACSGLSGTIAEDDGSAQPFKIPNIPGRAWFSEDELIVFDKTEERLAAVEKIDFHQHCTHQDEEGLKMLLAANRAWGVQRCVLLSLRQPKSTRQDICSRNDWILGMGQRYKQIVPFVTIIEDDPKAAAMLEDCIARGAKGLKMIGWHSNYIMEHDYNLRRPSLVDALRVAARHRIPVLVHLWLGFHHTKYDYVADVEALFQDIPDLRLVLAHFGLGFNPETLPALSTLLARHQQLYVDTSLYGTFCELWFSRASNQWSALASLVRRFPGQFLFGSDVFGRRRKEARDFGAALRASVAFLTEPSVSCPEFKRISYFDENTEDKYGQVVFEPLSLRGLALGDDAALLRRIFVENASELLQLDS